MNVAPVFVAIVTLLVYAGTGGDFSAARVFSAISVLNQLRFPLMFLPSVIQQIADAKVSLSRLDRFVQQPEVEGYLQQGKGGAVSDKTAPPSDSAAPSGSAESVAVPVTSPASSSASPATIDPSAGIAVTGATFHWENPSARVARLRKKAEEAAKAKEADEKKKAKTAGAGKKKGAPAPAPAPAAAPSDASSSSSAEPKPWEVPVPPALADVTFSVPKGQLYAVIGPVGAGKSALVQALLGELSKAAGSIAVNGRVAYVAQTAWVLNGSLRRNVTFAHEAAMGSAPSEEAYQRVLDVCQLRRDISVLVNGDATEIGERGINLSGGQRQRVSVARAAMSGADVIIFDDPLSALDAEVGKALFEQCIVGHLGGATRLLVTNQLQYLRSCDGIIVLERGTDGAGRVAMQGTYADLVNVPTFADMLKAYGESTSAAAQGGAAGGEGEDALAATPKPEAPAASPRAAPKPAAAAAAEPAGTVVAKDGKPAPPTPSGRLMTTEEKNEGAVPFSVWVRYFRAAGRMGVTVTALLLSYAINQLAQLISQWWVTFWTSDSSYKQRPVGLYMGVFVALGVASGIFSYTRVIVQLFASIRSSRALHSQLLSSILHAPLLFFDTTPLGRVLARFSKVSGRDACHWRLVDAPHTPPHAQNCATSHSPPPAAPLPITTTPPPQDVDSIDNQIAMQLGMLGMSVFFLIGSLAAIIFSTPWFALTSEYTGRQRAAEGGL